MGSARENIRTLLLAMAMAVLPAAAQTQPPAIDPALKPSFTADQVAQGQALYDLHCKSCHGPELEHGWAVALKGGGYALRLKMRQVHMAGFLDRIQRTMPRGRPNTLDPLENAAILAYILNRNGFTAGTEQLAPDDPRLGHISAVPPAAPKASAPPP